MVIKEQQQEQEEKLTFADMADYMLSLAELHNIIEESNAPQKYALQVKILDEIEAIIDFLSIRK
jgi:ATP-dependent Zn protease